MESNFPHARSLIAVRGWRGTKADLGQPRTRYFISSCDTQELTPARAMSLIRGHWGGVEIRNHWLRDACLSEDKTRSRNPHIVANLALLRNTLLKIIADHKPADACLPQLCETVAANPSFALKWIGG
jgi:predicted transposase YbfD/YdcC